MNTDRTNLKGEIIMNKQVFVVTAHHYHIANDHQYTVGVFDDFDKANSCARNEEAHRDRKYNCEIKTYDINVSIHADDYCQEEVLTIESEPETGIPVMIHLNDETGDVLWSVESKNDPDFWFASSATLDEALKYIEINNCIYNPEKDFYCSLSQERKDEYLVKATVKEFELIHGGRKVNPTKSR
jgi:hypothetical protein